MMPDLPRLMSLKQFSLKHPAFSEPSLRWLRFNQATNGFARAFLTVGRRVLIDEGEFFAAIERENRDRAVEAKKAA